MNNYIWSRKDVDLLPQEIAPWKLPRDKHATISVLKYRLSELHTVDDYLSRCEQEFDVKYIKAIYCSTEQAWTATKSKLNAQFNKRKRNVVLKCLQFGGNKEFWDDFPNEEEIEAYFHKCYDYAVNKIGFLGMDENIICAVIITEPNRRNLFVYYLPVTPKWKVKIISKDRNEYGTLLQFTDENGEPLYREKENFDSPLLCRTEFWKQRGGITSLPNCRKTSIRRFPNNMVPFVAKALHLTEALVLNREGASEDMKTMNTTLFPILTTYPTAIKISCILEIILPQGLDFSKRIAIIVLTILYRQEVK